MIRRTDRVADVLRRDDALIDVFTAASPAFERLRRPALRRVMARLVTVEQAARIAGIDPDELVARLNAGAAGAPAPRAGPDRVEREGSPAEPAPPAALTRIPEAAVVEVDVREDLRAGREPFGRIMAARRQVPEGGALRVRAIFEPVPLYAVLAKQGFAHHTERRGEEDWCVWFYRAAAGGTAGPAAPADRGGTSAAPGPAPTGSDDAGGVRVLDVRGLEPPEPMVRTLAALEAMPPGGTLVQLNVRVPRFLLPELERRGFSYEIREQAPDLVRVFIRRQPPPAT